MLPALRTEVPGPESRRLAGVLSRYESRNVTFVSPDWPIFWQRAEGANVWDVDGNRFLDFTSAFAVTGLGHGASRIREALHRQADELLHAMGDVHPTRGKAELCRRLSEITFERWNAGVGRTILANSGSEAIEAALKTALLFTSRRGVLSFRGAYHGLGYGALEAGGLPFFQNPFRDQLAGFGVRASYPTTDAELAASRTEIERLLASESIGAVLVEPIQGRGGEVVPAADFLPMLRELCDKHGALLVLDEIYTGFNRTGRLFACEHPGVVPDLICLGKGLTSGFPLAACVGREAVMNAWPPSSGEALHTSTFLGHPAGCAMALASISEHLRPETARLAATCSEALSKALADLKSDRIREIRGPGTMRGIELVTPTGEPDGKLAGAIVVQALKDGLLILAGGPAGNVLSLTPPFVVSAEEVSFAVGRIQEYLMSLPGSIS